MKVKITAVFATFFLLFLVHNLQVKTVSGNQRYSLSAQIVKNASPYYDFDFLFGLAEEEEDDDEAPEKKPGTHYSFLPSCDCFLIHPVYSDELKPALKSHILPDYDLLIHQSIFRI